MLVPPRMDSSPGCPPSIKLLSDDPLSPVLLKCNRSAILSVTVSGTPKPSVRWFIGQRLVREGPRYRLTSDGRDLHALMISPVTEELDSGVLVSAYNENGVNSKRIDVKTFRVFSRMESTPGAEVFEARDRRPHGKSAIAATLDSRRPLKEQPVRHRVKGRQSLGSSLTFIGPQSFHIAQDISTKKAFSSTDDVFDDRPGHYTSICASPSPTSPTNQLNSEIRLRPRLIAGSGSEGRKKKAFSWVENLVQELPSPTIKPGVWNPDRPGHLSLGCPSLTSPQTPVTVLRSALPLDYNANRVDRPPPGQTRQTPEDVANEVLWQMYGFKLSRERPCSPPSSAVQRSSFSRANRELTNYVEPLHPGHNALRQRSVPATDPKRMSAHVILEEPVYSLPLKKAQPKSRSTSGLEILAREANRRSDPNVLYLKTNLRTVRCDNPISHPTNDPPGNNGAIDRPITTNSAQRPRNLDTTQSATWRSSDELDHQKLNRINEGRVVDPRVSNHMNSITHDHREYFRPTGRPTFQQSINPGSSRNVQDLRPWGGPGGAGGQARPASAASCDPGIRWRSSGCDPAERRRKAYSATVNFRSKAEAETNAGVTTKFIVVDIDLDSRSGTGVSAGSAAVAAGNSGVDQNWERGRSRTKLASYEDQRRVITRSHSADASTAYLFQKMYSIQY